MHVLCPKVPKVGPVFSYVRPVYPLDFLGEVLLVHSRPLRTSRPDLHEEVAGFPRLPVRPCFLGRSASSWGLHCYLNLCYAFFLLGMMDLWPFQDKCSFW